MQGNRKYKNDVFCMLMEIPKYALEVYNALNGTNYTNPDEVEITNLERGVSLTVNNDASFIVDNSLGIYEHQSSVCPNMPLRSLIYLANILEGRLAKKNLYGRKLIMIPKPKFVVFYNGLEDQPEKYELKLSDAFLKASVDSKLFDSTDADIELKCTVYNINYGKNANFLDKCQVLKDYMFFVDSVRYFNSQDDIELGDAIEMAIDRCIEQDKLKDFMIENRLEVAKVTKLDYTFERQILLEREEAKAEGYTQGQNTIIIKFAKEGKISLEEGAREMGISVKEFKEML